MIVVLNRQGNRGLPKEGGPSDSPIWTSVMRSMSQSTIRLESIG